MNPQWNMCSKGRRQSPINVEPDKLLYDPYLRHIHLDKHKVNIDLFVIYIIFWLIKLLFQDYLIMLSIFL